MKKLKFKTWLLLTAVALGCSSAEKRAAELFEKGSYEEAESAYENVVRDEPNNADARAGLQKARLKVLDAHLIGVRKARIAGISTPPALIDILALEAKWALQPPGPMAFTQREELDYATSALIDNLSDAKFAKIPLYREYQLRSYEPLFQVSHSADFKKLRASNLKDGQNVCRDFSRQLKPDMAYSAHFTKRFCNFWKAHEAVPADDGTFNRDLVSEVAARFSLTGFDKDVERDLNLRLNSALRTQPWYSASGKTKLSLVVNGSWTHNLQRNTTQLLHNYGVEEAYVENVNVTKTRQVPYTTTNYRYDPNTQANTPVTKTEYKDETYLVSEPQTKYHTVQKTYPYGGWQLNQALKVHFDAAGNLAGRGISLLVNDESNTQDTQSDASYPSIGLQPKQAALIPNPVAWLQSHEQALADQLNEKSSAIWFDLYCKDGAVSNFAASGNLVQRCLRLPTAAANPPSFAETWYQKFIGLRAQQAESLLK